MCVMTFGAKCSPVCAQFVKNYIAEKFATDEVTRTAITKKFYVDDYLDSTDTEENALEIILNIQSVLSSGGFEIVNWMTNSKYVQETSCRNVRKNEGN